jgi:hypothetical protein
VTDILAVGERSVVGQLPSDTMSSISQSITQSDCAVPTSSTSARPETASVAIGRSNTRPEAFSKGFRRSTRIRALSVAMRSFCRGIGLVIAATVKADANLHLLIMPLTHTPARML